MRSHRCVLGVAESPCMNDAAGPFIYFLDADTQA